MMVENFQELTNLQVDALKEIGNIGAGNAATALAQIINTKIDMNVPRVSILEFDKVPALIGGADTYVVGIYLTVFGSAGMDFITSLSSSKTLNTMKARTDFINEPGSTATLMAAI
jgi:chemotaxis protein CheC